MSRKGYYSYGRSRPKLGDKFEILRTDNPDLQHLVGKIGHSMGHRFLKEDVEPLVLMHVERTKTTYYLGVFKGSELRRIK